MNDWVEIECESYHDSDYHPVIQLKVIENPEYLRDGNLLEVMENTVTGVGKGILKKAVEMSEEDANELIEILENGNWVEKITECDNDYALNIKGRLIYYHSECGTFYLYDLLDMSYFSSQEKEVDGISLKLSEEDRLKINKKIEFYVNN